MPYIRIWIHLIFSTKNRDKTITKSLKPQLIKHILENAREKEIFIDFINCVEDHCHILISLGSGQSVSEIARLIKGESSRWVNKNKLSKFKFSWQEEYIAVSVSESQVNKVREYIKNQEEHHRVKSFSEEYSLFLKKHGFTELG
ncbi:MAG: IS200/IS605 family transposase [Calditrichae bacterium]|nr:IS200/IS605 family transposase [Calditrichota bacterium]MCB9057988.1 IS200/IS605 family transposase [Calditrichia bacterium]